MNVIETLSEMGDRLQVAMVVGSVPLDGTGDIEILYANAPAAALFGYPSPYSMKGMDVRNLIPPEIAKDHRSIVAGYVEKANGGTVRTSSVMGSWRALFGVRKDGSQVALQVNVADIRNSEERYFVGMFRDRTRELQVENDLQNALKQAEEEAERSLALKRAAEAAQAAAEDSLLKQKRLSGQITLLRQIFHGTVGLVCLLGFLVAVSWATGTTDKDALSMIERVLLVLTGILGSAMSSVFDSRHKADS